MTLPTIETVRGWQELTLVAASGEPIGKIESIYIDRETRQPEWLLVRSGLAGSSRTFVPLLDAAQEGDMVRVPHHVDAIHGAPGTDPSGELSEDEEARLYAHYGIDYSTAASSSGLPAGESSRDPGGAGVPAAARGRLTVHQDAPAAAAPVAAGDAAETTSAVDAGTVAEAQRATGGTASPEPTGTPRVITTEAGRLDAADARDASTAAAATQRSTGGTARPELGDITPGERPQGGGRAGVALAGAGAAAAVAWVVVRRRRARQRPAGLAGALVALGLTRPPRGSLTDRVLGRQPRPTGVVGALSNAGQDVTTAARQAVGQTSVAARGVGRAVGQGTAAARGVGQALGQGAGSVAREVGGQMTTARRRVSGQPTTRVGRAKAGASKAAGVLTGPVRRLQRRRARAKARRRLTEQAAGLLSAWSQASGKAAGTAGLAARSAAGTVGGLPAQAAKRAKRAKRKARRADAGGTAARARRRVRDSVPRRRRRSRRMGKLTGRLGMAIGAAAGYVLGAKAGRERYEQLAGAAKKLTEQPPVKRVVEQAPGTVSATVDKVADRAADKVRQAGDRVASGGRNGGADPVVRVRDTAPSGGRLAEDPVPPPVPASPKVTNPASGQTTKP